MIDRSNSSEARAVRKGFTILVVTLHLAGQSLGTNSVSKLTEPPRERRLSSAHSGRDYLSTQESELTAFYEAFLRYSVDLREKTLDLHLRSSLGLTATKIDPTLYYESTMAN